MNSPLVMIRANGNCLVMLDPLKPHHVRNPLVLVTLTSEEVVGCIEEKLVMNLMTTSNATHNRTVDGLGCGLVCAFAQGSLKRTAGVNSLYEELV